MADSVRRDDLFCRNMAALYRVDPRLAHVLDNLPDDPNVTVEASKRGPATASVVVPESPRPVALHSRIDPVAEARRFAEGVEIGESFCYAVSGFGLGHHLLALRERLKGDAFLLVAESNLALLKAALETVDLAELFEGDRCIILTGADKGALQTRLEPYNTLIMMGAQFVSHPASERANKEFHAEMRRLLADHMTFCRMSLMTLVANSRTTCHNIAHNLPRYVSTPDIGLLRDRFEGYPGIVVSAGPSLRKNIDQLSALKGRAIIIAVQSTFKTLLDRGIRPDFVTALDYHEMSMRFFEEIDDYEGIHLVAEPKANWNVIDRYTGPVSLLDNAFARLCLGDALGARPGLKAGATVSHLSVYLAMHLGCYPIVLLGQDLGYTNHVYYVPGTAIHGMWRPELNRFCTMEMKEWERIVRHRKLLSKVKDIHGHAIYTDEQLFTYQQQFEGDFASMPDRVIDATEGGVKIAGTRVMDLSDVAEGYCTREIPPDRFDYLRDSNWRNASRLKLGSDEIRKRLDEVDTMMDTCRKMLTLLNELKGLVSDPKTFNRRIADVDALRVKIRAMDRTYRTISMVAQHAELQRFSADRRLGLENVDGAARAKRQLERDTRFVEAFLEGGEVLTGILNDTRQRFEDALAESARAPERGEVTGA